MGKRNREIRNTKIRMCCVCIWENRNIWEKGEILLIYISLTDFEESGENRGNGGKRKNRILSDGF